MIEVMPVQVAADQQTCKAAEASSGDEQLEELFQDALSCALQRPLQHQFILVRSAEPAWGTRCNAQQVEALRGGVI